MPAPSTRSGPVPLPPSTSTRYVDYPYQPTLRANSLTRLNRTLGIGQIMCTHTMGDLKLSSDHLTEIAWGFVERSAMVFLGGLAEREMGNLEEVFMLSQDEKSMITDWSAEGGINPDTNRAASPPGLGKFILKIGRSRKSVPVSNDHHRGAGQRHEPGVDQDERSESGDVSDGGILAKPADYVVCSSAVHHRRCR